MVRLIDENGERLVTQSEYDLIMASKYVWSKEAHIAEINQLHEEVFQNTLINYEYIDKWEVLSASVDKNNKYYDEAIKLMRYWWEGWQDIKTYSEIVTEETQIKSEDFVKNLVEKYL